MEQERGERERQGAAGRVMREKGFSREWKNDEDERESGTNAYEMGSWHSSGLFLFVFSFCSRFLV